MTIHHLARIICSITSSYGDAQAARAAAMQQAMIYGTGAFETRERRGRIVARKVDLYPLRPPKKVTWWSCFAPIIMPLLYAAAIVAPFVMVALFLQKWPL